MPIVASRAYAMRRWAMEPQKEQEIEMSNEKWIRYTRGESPFMATENVGRKQDWGSLDTMRTSTCSPQTGTEYRVTVEAIEPVAEVEMKQWWCYWNTWSGYTPGSGNAVADSTYFKQYWNVNGGMEVSGLIHSTTQPALAEFADAFKDATGVEIPVPVEEEPQWWEWSDEEWGESEHTGAYCSDSYDSCRVYGTRDTIDAKRDALLAAAREAGKP